ncbi:MAG TPA: crossover junction endodeoxyribonuclease RuvC, partial [Gemmatimonadales bacterium]|nr:crossover junction endodeoxyribonuclease RuvC [Gemmatimonadales bacterium]
IECGVVRTPATLPLAVRLATIHEGVAELIGRHRPDAIAVEGVFYGKNVRSAIILSHARGVVLLAAQQAAIPTFEYSPARVKKSVVGRGAAVKAQVGYAVAKLLRLKSAPTPADAADAVAIALTHLLTTR